MYRYRIEEFLNKRIYRDKVKAIHELAALLKITTNRLWRIRMADMNSKTSASVEQLKIIADYFNVRVDDLINHKGPAAKS